MKRIVPQEAALLVVDVQEKLAAAMPEAQMAALTRAATVLIEAARLLGVTVVATEQYPKGLGPTIAPIRSKLEEMGAPILPKMEFSACDAAAFEQLWDKQWRPSVIVVGMEAHVCVFQTVRELCARDLTVLVPLDGVASRREDHRSAGLDLCEKAGATITTMETVVFDMLRMAGTDPFKQLSKLIR